VKESWLSRIDESVGFGGVLVSSMVGRVPRDWGIRDSLGYPRSPLIVLSDKNKPT